MSLGGCGGGCLVLFMSLVYFYVDVSLYVTIYLQTPQIKFFVFGGWFVVICRYLSFFIATLLVGGEGWGLFGVWGWGCFVSLRYLRHMSFFVSFFLALCHLCRCV